MLLPLHHPPNDSVPVDQSGPGLILKLVTRECVTLVCVSVLLHDGDWQLHVPPLVAACVAGQRALKKGWDCVICSHEAFSGRGLHHRKAS